MKNKPTISTSRAVEIYREVISCRRDYCADSDFFKMPDVWDYLCDDDPTWSMKLYRTNEFDDFKRKAGVVCFDGRLRLTADEEIFARAKVGCSMMNFILAHELGHVALRHHENSAVIKNFQLFSGPGGMSNMPPTPEELEANFAAVFFQCGVALEDIRWSAADLAKRAFSDRLYVEKAKKIVQLEVFQKELRQKQKITRV